MINFNYAVNAYFFWESLSTFEKWTKKMSNFNFPKKLSEKKTESFLPEMEKKWTNKSVNSC